MSLTSLELGDQRSILWGHGIFSGMYSNQHMPTMWLQYHLAWLCPRFVFDTSYVIIFIFIKNWKSLLSAASRKKPQLTHRPGVLDPLLWAWKRDLQSPRWHGSCFGKWRKYQGMWSFHTNIDKMNGYEWFLCRCRSIFRIFILKPIGLPPDIIGPSPGVALVCVERIAVRLSSSPSQSCGTAMAVIF